MRVYLDNCCFNRPYDLQSQMRISLETQAKLYIQDLIKNRELELAASYMLRFENEQNPYEIRRQAITEYIRNHTTIYIDYDRMEDVAKEAELIMAAGIRKKDAIHVASAILAECDCFLTTDVRLLKYKTDRIIMENPIDFIQRWEGGQNG
ncbi:MAG: hypothetical protein NC302_05060 [Bacteroidales bacterium]|nr:hypothetical protein [Bacteroidales bacterium]MCM1416496.1 hypothetical protein [bacterium]MCM1422667.1 hypothetical protein [bacterium]